MTKTIWKFPFPIEDRISMILPDGAKILSVQVQAGDPCMWALVEPTAPEVRREFCLYGTGHTISDPFNLLEFVATFQYGPLVFHVFELLPNMRDLSLKG